MPGGWMFDLIGSPWEMPRVRQRIVLGVTDAGEASGAGSGVASGTT